MPEHHVVMFSGGPGSWLTARRVAEQHGTDNLTLLSREQRVEALAEAILDHPRFGCGCCTYSEPCPTCDAEDYDFSPHECPRDLDRETSMAQALLDSPAMRDLLAEAWDEGFDRGFYDVLPGGSRDASESAAANPYRETSKERADD